MLSCIYSGLNQYSNVFLKFKATKESAVSIRIRNQALAHYKESTAKPEEVKNRSTEHDKIKDRSERRKQIIIDSLTIANIVLIWKQ